MARRKTSALLLDASVVAGVEPVTFAGFPGRYVPGEPVEFEALSAASGIEASALLASLDDLGLPLEVVEVRPGAGPLPVPDNHVGRGETFGLADESEDDEDPDEAEEPVSEEGDV